MADDPLELFTTAGVVGPNLGSFDRHSYRQRLAKLADQGIYVGTSSWKYSGWWGLVCD